MNLKEGKSYCNLRDCIKVCALDVGCLIPLFSHFALRILGTWLILSLIDWMVHLCRIRKDIKAHISTFFSDIAQSHHSLK